MKEFRIIISIGLNYP